MNKKENTLSKQELLESFMKEFFPFKVFKKCGFFTKEMKGDYSAQAERVCNYFGYDTVYEYGSEEMRAHLSYLDNEREKGEPFVTTIKSIYD